eukprot:jgi/Mesvir1/5890/Mv00662-RA.1
MVQEEQRQQDFRFRQSAGGSISPELRRVVRDLSLLLADRPPVNRSFVQFVDDQVEDWERILRHVQTIVIPEHRSIGDLEQELHGLVGIQTVITAVAERVRTELAARRGEVAEAAGAGRHEFVPTVAGAGVPRAFAGGIGDEGVAAGPVRRERRGAEHHRRLAEVGATAEAIAGGPRATRVGRFPERVRVPFQELPPPLRVRVTRWEEFAPLRYESDLEAGAGGVARLGDEALGDHEVPTYNPRGANDGLSPVYFTNGDDSVIAGRQRVDDGAAGSRVPELIVVSDSDDDSDKENQDAPGASRGIYFKLQPVSAQRPGGSLPVAVCSFDDERSSSGDRPPVNRSFVQFVDDQVEDWERILRHVQTIVIPEHRSIGDLEQELHGLVGIQTVITAVAERVRTELAARRGEVAEAAGAGRHEFVPTVAGAGVPRAFAGGIGDEGVAAGPVRRERRGAEHHRRLAEVGATAEAIAGGPRATRVGRFPERVRVPFQELPPPLRVRVTRWEEFAPLRYESDLEVGAGGVAGLGDEALGDHEVPTYNPRGANDGLSPVYFTNGDDSVIAGRQRVDDGAAGSRVPELIVVSDSDDDSDKENQDAPGASRGGLA